MSIEEACGVAGIPVTKRQRKKWEANKGLARFVSVAGISSKEDLREALNKASQEAMQEH